MFDFPQIIDLLLQSKQTRNSLSQHSGIITAFNFRWRSLQSLTECVPVAPLLWLGREPDHSFAAWLSHESVAGGVIRAFQWSFLQGILLLCLDTGSSHPSPCLGTEVPVHALFGHHEKTVRGLFKWMSLVTVSPGVKGKQVPTTLFFRLSWQFH